MKFKAAAVLTALLVSVSAHAGLLGKSIAASWTYKTFRADYTVVAAPGPELVGGFAEDPFQAFGFQGFTLDIGNDYVDVSSDFTPTPRVGGRGLSKGITWTFSGLDFAPSFNVLATSNFAGFGLGDVAYGATSITYTVPADFDLISGHNFLHLQLVPVDAIPEPTTMALMVGGLLLLGANARRRKPHRE